MTPLYFCGVRQKTRLPSYFYGIRQMTPLYFCDIRQKTPLYFYGIRQMTPLYFCGIRQMTPLYFCGTRQITPLHFCDIRQMTPLYFRVIRQMTLVCVVEHILHAATVSNKRHNILSFPIIQFNSSICDQQVEKIWSPACPLNSLHMSNSVNICVGSYSGRGFTISSTFCINSFPSEKETPYALHPSAHHRIIPRADNKFRRNFIIRMLYKP